MNARSGEGGGADCQLAAGWEKEVKHTSARFMFFYVPLIHNFVSVLFILNATAMWQVPSGPRLLSSRSIPSRLVLLYEGDREKDDDVSHLQDRPLQ